MKRAAAPRRSIYPTACNSGRQVRAIARPVSQAAPPPSIPVTSAICSIDSVSYSSPVSARLFPSPRSEKSTSSMPYTFQIEGAYFRPLQQFLSAAGERDQAIHHDIATVRELERMEGILSDQEPGKFLLPIEGADRGEDLLHQQRRKTE